MHDRYRLVVVKRDRRGVEMRPLPRDGRLFDRWRDAVAAAGELGRGDVIVQSVVVDDDGVIVFPTSPTRSAGNWRHVPRVTFRGQRPASPTAAPRARAAPRAPERERAHRDHRHGLDPRTRARIAAIRRTDPGFGRSITSQ